ncbi:MAG: hypothetical protein NTV89_18920, partial [Proteobacteria bacterium]|nr:hypothetical protein [Pseudomonadota bacterium]
AAEHAGAQYWIVFTMKQFLFGSLLGGLVGWLGGMLVDRASKAGWMNSTFQRLTAGSLAVLAFALAEVFHGNGFIAAFFGGLMLGIHWQAIFFFLFLYALLALWAAYRFLPETVPPGRRVPLVPRQIRCHKPYGDAAALAVCCLHRMVWPARNRVNSLPHHCLHNYRLHRV